MKFLIDSHVLVWTATGQGGLPARVMDALADLSNQVLVSVATAYELEFKRSRDPIIAQLPGDLDEAVSGQSFAWLSITQQHATSAGRLPRLHGDPFDRIIIAQAFAEGAAVVSADTWFPAYGVPVVW
jgi:PIN domain nuclease of toxin-antitoxin system